MLLVPFISVINSINLVIFPTLNSFSNNVNSVTCNHLNGPIRTSVIEIPCCPGPITGAVLDTSIRGDRNSGFYGHQGFDIIIKTVPSVWHKDVCTTAAIQIKTSFYPSKKSSSKIKIVSQTLILKHTHTHTHIHTHTHRHTNKHRQV